MTTEPQMKPQETIIFMLGKLDGQMASVTATVTASSAAQASVNAENKREHEEFRATLQEQGLDINTLKSTQPVKVSPWSKAGVIIALPSSVVALIGFVLIYFNR